MAVERHRHRSISIRFWWVIRVGAKATSLPVYDKPVYDYDIFDGVPGLEYLGFGELRCVFDGSGSKQKQNDAFDDLLGGCGRKDPEPKRSGNVEDVGSGFDDLLHGFGRISLPSNRPTTDVNWAPKSTVNATETTSNVIEDPFVVLESTSTPAVSSLMLFTDPLEEISKLGNSGSTRVERVAAEARERAAAEARERAAARVNQQKNENDLESFFSMSSRPSSAPRPRANSSDPIFGIQFQNRHGPEMARTSASASSTMRKASPTTNIVDDLSSILELLHHLENSKKLKGKVKTDGEPGWNITKGLRSMRQKHWLRKISGISKLRGNKQRDMGRFGC